jgi:hypothetical protein
VSLCLQTDDDEEERDRLTVSKERDRLTVSKERDRLTVSSRIICCDRKGDHVVLCLSVITFLVTIMGRAAGVSRRRKKNNNPRFKGKAKLKKEKAKIHRVVKIGK